MTTSIHQPNYIPWTGFFNKVLLSDIHIVFDDVQFPRSKEFGNRNKIKTNNGSIWLTVPVIGKSEFRNFNEIEINKNGWNNKHLDQIGHFYKKSPYFDLYFDDIKDLTLEDYPALSELNTALNRYFLKKLDYQGKIILSSTLCNGTELGKDEKIFYLLDKVNTTEYISGDGPGSRRYIREEDFYKRGIKLEWQRYKHPSYSQQYGEFMPYMSILDLLFNEGPNSRNIILQ